MSDKIGNPYTNAAAAYAEVCRFVEDYRAQVLTDYEIERLKDPVDDEEIVALAGQLQALNTVHDYFSEKKEHEMKMDTLYRAMGR